MANASPVNCDKQVHHISKKKDRSAHLSSHHQTTQMYSIGGEAASSTTARSRGKHFLPDLEPHDIVNFAPHPRQEHSTQRPLSASEISGSDSKDDNAEEEFHAVKSSIPNYLRNSSSHICVQESTENLDNDACHESHAFEGSTLVRSSNNNNKDREQRSPVCRLQSIDPDNGSYQEEQVLPQVTSGQAQENGGTLTAKLGEHDDTAPTAADDPPSPEINASRSSSAPAAILYKSTVPLVRNHRVTKAYAAISSPRLQRSSPTPVPVSTSTPSRVPTEEDLLLLLMRRQRFRDQAHSQLLGNLRQLQAENQHLVKQGLARDAELVEVQRAWRGAVRESHIREKQVRAFGEKYDKLKTWACEMHDAFASTRTEGSRLNDEVTKLKSESEAHSRERNEMLDKIEGLAEPVRRFKETVAELQATFVKLKNAQKSLSQAQDEVQDEQSKNKAHIRRIEQLERYQESTNSRFLKQQDEIQSSLSLLMSMFKGNDYSFLQDVVVELADTMQGLKQHVATKEESSAQFSSILDITEKNYTKLTMAISGIANAQIERQITRHLAEEMDQLKAKHSSDLADVSKQQHEAIANLQKAQDELRKETARFDEVEYKWKEGEQRLSDQVAQLEELKRNLSVEQYRVMGLQDTKNRLERKIVDTDEACQNLQNTIQQLEEDDERHKTEQERLAKILRTSEARREELERIVSDYRVSIGQKDARIVELETSRTQYKTANQKSQEELNDAQDEISNLKSTINGKDSDLRALQKDLELAQTSANRVHGLQELVDKQATNIKVLSENIESSRAEVTKKGTEILEKQRKIKELKQNVSEITNRSQELAAAAREQCDKKDEEMDALRVEKDKEIDDLKTENAQLAADLSPLSTLVNLLTDDEKMALDEKLVQRVKSMIRYLHEQDCNNLGDANGITRPRRAADRETRVSEEEIVVPDSQSQHPQPGIGNGDLSYDTEGFDAFINENVGPITNIRTNPELVVGSRAVPELNDTAVGQVIRPGTSNDEMLLRSSDTGSYPRSQTQALVLVPASSIEVSPMRTRQGSQIRHGTPRPQSSADGDSVINFSTPPAYPREVHPPNSAAKRRQSSEVAEPPPKRRTVNMKNLEVRSSKHSSGSSLGQCSDAENSRASQDLPPGARKSLSIAPSEMPAPQSKTKKQIAKSSKKSSKAAQYGTRFTASPV